MNIPTEIPQSFLDLIKDAKSAVSDSHSLLASFKQDRRTYWQKLLGPRLEDLLGSKQETLDCLNSPIAEHRIGAIEILVSHWSPDNAIAQKFEEMAKSDPNPQVRALAVSAFGRFNEGSKSSQSLRLLSAIFEDESAPTSVRAMAYRQLFVVSGAPVDSWPDPTAFRFPQDVNWAFVSELTKIS